ncbi:hypothetical protein AVEN_6490-1 [Araneus ventricosus]|uniref:Uncharacterized protein n=1 Tax=Araneus ventricosus TaxID=182803 RepID=A0A4Y2H7M7_ARAVE|nr:hypothetical protein AVEN_6490-1 [Araneus ventricosus]
MKGKDERTGDGIVEWSAYVTTCTVVPNSQSRSFEVAGKRAMPSYEHNFVPRPLPRDQCDLWTSLLYQRNALAQLLKMTLEGMSTDQCKLIIRADKTPVGEHERRFNAPTVCKVAIVMVADASYRRDIIIEKRCEGLEHIAETHRSYDSLQYPIIF